MNNQQYKWISVVSLLIAVAALSASIWTNVRAQEIASAAVPQTINYQGNLRDSGGLLITGSHQIMARVYAAATGGTALYDTGQETVFVRDGLFNIVIGDEGKTPSIKDVINANGTNLYIGITLDSANSADELIPRQRLHAVPWAFVADNALTANALKDGITINNVTLAGNTTVTGTLNKGIEFLPRYEIVPDCNKFTWTTVDISSAVPDQATAVMLQVMTRTTGNIGQLLIRPDANWAGGNEYGGFIAAMAETSASVTQGIYPFNKTAQPRTFQYRTTNDGFNTQCTIDIVGYVR